MHKTSTLPFLFFQLFTKNASDFLRKAITDVLTERERTKVVRNDLIDMLLTLRDEDRTQKVNKHHFGKACLSVIITDVL